MGGWVGFLLLKLFPDRFLSFVIMGAHPFFTDTSPIRELVESFPDWVQERQVSRARKGRLRNNDPMALRAAAAANRPDLSEALAQAAVPVLLVAGTEDPRHEGMERSKELSAGAVFVSLPGIDHHGTFERRDLVLPRLDRFYAGLVQT